MFNIIQILKKKIFPIKSNCCNNIGEIDNYLREEMQREMGFRPYSVQEMAESKRRD